MLYKKIFTNPRVIILIVSILLAIVAIHPNPYNKGVAIRIVRPNSSASLAGIAPPTSGPPMSREVIISMNNIPITSMKDYYEFISKLKPNRTVYIRTNKKGYTLKTIEKIEIIELNETETKVVKEEIYNETINKTVNITKIIVVPKKKVIHTGKVEDIGLVVYDAPKTNLRKGLDLEGGTRVLLKPEKMLSSYDLDSLIDNMKERLNVYGLTDLVIRKASDLSGNQYILVEIPGANEEEVKELLEKQGKFEAKIGNKTVFRGGNDITFVCRSGDCAGIDPTFGCSRTNGQWICRFRFSITLSLQAAQRQANITKDLDVAEDQQYLSEKLVLFLDDKKVEELNIAAELKNRVATDIQISGAGVGNTKEEAIYNALKNMKRLQTILITGSLPVKLDIIRTTSISPVLGKEFIKNALLIGLIALLVVIVIAFLRYKKVQVIVPMSVTLICEVIILLGIAALIGWNLDLAAIAGIIIALGTGVDHQIVITDETLKGEAQVFNWKERIKRAFFIIFGAYLTTVVAMLPLVFAGAGLLKGFAITTIIGVSIGVFITRPAYAKIIEILLRE